MLGEEDFDEAAFGGVWRVWRCYDMLRHAKWAEPRTIRSRNPSQTLRAGDAAGCRPLYVKVS